MRRKTRSGLEAGRVILAAIFVVLLSGTQGAGQKEKDRLQDRDFLIAPVDGAELFRGFCAACHGTDATGNGPAASALKKPPADLTRISQRNGSTFPRERVKRYISGEADLLSHGSREMPIWGPIFRQLDRDAELGEIRIHNLAVYIESLQKTNLELLSPK